MIKFVNTLAVLFNRVGMKVAIFLAMDSALVQYRRLLESMLAAQSAGRVA